MNHWRRHVAFLRLSAAAVLFGASSVLLVGIAPGGRGAGPAEEGPLLVIAFNDLGMHCMNEGFSELAVLPPYNTIKAQVIVRGEEPEILNGDATVRYAVPGNSRSADKTDFWVFAPQLFGVELPPDIGLTGHGLSGTMVPNEEPKFWEVTGIPITPIDDAGRLNPYPLATIDVTGPGGMTATTVTVVPVSSELSCNLCHNAQGISTATDILRAHDTLHGTSLESQKPVLCASCHADNALGLPGVPGVPNLSSAMHSAHAPRMGELNLQNECYACHP
jgi:hypothetical protein